MTQLSVDESKQFDIRLDRCVSATEPIQQRHLLDRLFELEEDACTPIALRVT